MKNWLLILLLSGSVWLQGQNNRTFKTLTIRNGLSQSTVTGITQDGNGFIWISTNFGLNRFDGYTVTIYNSDRNGRFRMPYYIFRTAVTDREGTIFVSCDDLVYFNKSKDRFSSIDTNSYNAERIFFDSLNNIWFTYYNGDLAFYDRRSHKIRNFICSGAHAELSYKDIRFATMIDDEVWISYENDQQIDHFSVSAFYYNGFKPSVSHYPFPHRVHKILKLGGDIFALSDNAKLYRYNKPEGRFNLVQHNFRNIHINDLIQDPFQKLWVATDSGLFECDTAFRIRNIFTVSNSDIPSDNVSHMFIDRTGVLWIGSGNGVAYTDLYAKQFRTYSYMPGLPMSLPSRYVYGASFDKKGDLWISTSHALTLLDEKNRAMGPLSGFSKAVNQFIHNQTWNMMIPYEGSCMVSLGVGINKINLKEKSLQYSHPVTGDSTSLEQWKCWCIHKGKVSGKYWIGQQGSLYCSIDHPDSSMIPGSLARMPEKITRYSPSHEMSKSIWALFEDRDGILWIGSSWGLYALYPDQHIEEMPSVPDDPATLSHRSIKCLLEDSDGFLWVGTESTGLNRLDKKTGKFRRYNTTNGLCSNNVVGILEDDHDRLWISTRCGLSCMDKKTERFKNYYYSDGLQSNEFNLFCSSKSLDGRMCFGGVDGITVFHPDSIRDNPFRPRTLITGLFVFNKPVSVGDTVNGDMLLKESVQNTREVTFSYKNKVFSFEFVGIHYASPEMIRYKYMLEGFDTDWRETPSSNRMAHYTNLPAGKYTFRVKSANLDDLWDDKGESMLIITVLPPWWETVWFRIVAVIAGILAVGAAFWGRIKQVEYQKRILQQQVEEQTLEIREKADILRQVNEQLVEQQNELQETNVLLEERQEEILSQKEEIEHQADKLQSANATKDKFFSIIGHDLKNPMYAISGVAKILKDGCERMEKDQLKELCGMLDQSTEGVTALLENLLTWARTQSGSVELKQEEFDLSLIVRSTVQVLKMNADTKGLKLNSEVKEGTMVYADKNMITTVIRNLVNNALKFTAQGGVTIRTERMGNDIELHVSDTGVGMDEEARKKLFRIDQNHSTKGTSGEAGTGLGLIICQEFVVLNRGRIWVESAPGKGSDFIFTIPCTQ